MHPVATTLTGIADLPWNDEGGPGLHIPIVQLEGGAFAAPFEWERWVAGLDSQKLHTLLVDALTVADDAAGVAVALELVDFVFTSSQAPRSLLSVTPEQAKAVRWAAFRLAARAGQGQPGLHLPDSDAAWLRQPRL